MKLRTSYFNITVLRKNLTRFAPLWILATVAQVLLLLMILSRDAARVASELAGYPGPITLYNAGYGLICAACLFGDLFNSRMCNALHAMPMKREGWLLTNLASGAILALIPAVFGAVCGVALTREYFQVALLWQAASLLQFVVFFGMAVFCAMCAGTKLGMFSLYGVLNLTPLLVYVMVYYFYEPLLYGVKFHYDNFLLFIPFLQLLTTPDFILFEYDKMGSFFRGCNGGAWAYLWICVAISVVLMVAAWLIYRRRHLERAGEFITVKPMRYVFLVVFTMGVATFLYAIFDLFIGNTNYLYLVIGLVLGYFGGAMLLERSAKVFRIKVIGGFAALCLVFLASFGITAADPFGVVTYVPPTDSVEKAFVFANYAYYDREGWADQLNWGSSPQEISDVRQLHQNLAEAGMAENMNRAVSCRVAYQLKDGSSLWRNYWVNVDTEVGQQLQALCSDFRNVLEVGSLAEAERTLTYMTAISLEKDQWQENQLTAQQKTALLEAILKDCQAGVMAQDSNFHFDSGILYYVDLYFESPNPGSKYTSTRRTKTIYVFEECTNTLAALRSMEFEEMDG